MIARLNPVLRGWGNYFRTGTAYREFLAIDEYVHERLFRGSGDVADSARASARNAGPASGSAWACIVSGIVSVTRRKPSREDHR